MVIYPSLLRKKVVVPIPSYIHLPKVEDISSLD